MTIVSLKKKIEDGLRSVLTLKAKTRVNSFFPLKPIPIEICSSSWVDKIIYKSPLCLQIAKIEGENPHVMAEKIVNLWVNSKKLAPLDLQVKISGDGWLEFIIGDRLLEKWLQELPKIEFPPQPHFVTKNQVDFQLYYAHARCCSLLRSAHQAQLIQLKTLDFSQSIWLWDQPESIPYHCGCLKFRYEKKLIFHLTTIVDAIDEQKESNWLKLASDFAKVILDFERYSRIFGEVKRENPALSQARLGLIALAQFYFQWIIEQKLGAIAPSEL
jgi:arginyl-tRNA synthetase